jgi:acetyl esterase/lipase
MGRDCLPECKRLGFERKDAGKDKDCGAMASEKDVTYANASGLDLKLDIYRPEGPSKRAAILYFHGGGWRGGSREGMRNHARAMAAYGYVGLPAQYRLLGQAPFPAQIEDVKTAVRWARAHAGDLDIDPGRIILWGSSAGAHLSLLAAGAPNHARFEGKGWEGHSSAVSAVIAEHPPVEFHLGAALSRHTTPGENLLGEGATAERAREASPLTYAREDFPPTLLLHGTYDRLVNHAASEAMTAALRAAKAPVDLHLFHGHNHGFASLPSMREQIAAEADYFLDRTLIDPAKYEAEAQEFSMFARRAAEERARAAAS